VKFTIEKIAGSDAVRLLNEHRSRFASTGLYPFLIGDQEELDRIQENAEPFEQDASAIIEESFRVNLADWFAERRDEAEEFDLDEDDLLGEWPDEVVEKGSIGLHKDILSGEIKPEVYFGLARIEMPWQLPAILKYGSWNECPGPEVHCALFRHWQEKYGAEITGMSGDVVECVVSKPPTNREDAIALAWEQYLYCVDIVEQGCGSVANLAATLMNSTYWYFWWD
jgi:hypothetical protein